MQCRVLSGGQTVGEREIESKREAPKVGQSRIFFSLHIAESYREEGDASKSTMQEERELG